MTTPRLMFMLAALLLALPAWGQDTPPTEPAAEEPATEGEENPEPKAEEKAAGEEEEKAEGEEEEKAAGEEGEEPPVEGEPAAGDEGPMEPVAPPADEPEELAEPIAPPPEKEEEPEPEVDDTEASSEVRTEMEQDFSEPDDDDLIVFERGGLFGAGVVIGLKAGGGFSQVFSELGASVVAELELGYNFPFLNRALGLYVTGSYAGPSSEGQAAQDPRLPGSGVPEYTLTQQQAIIGLGLIYRIKIPDLTIFAPYVSAGGRAYLMRTEVSASVDGEPFGENTEDTLSFGFSGAVGGELYLGPGALLLEVQVGWAPMDGFVLRNTNVGALNVSLGYRIFL